MWTGFYMPSAYASVKKVVTISWVLWQEMTQQENTNTLEMGKFGGKSPSSFVPQSVHILAYSYWGVVQSIDGDRLEWLRQIKLYFSALCQIVTGHFLSNAVRLIHYTLVDHVKQWRGFLDKTPDPLNLNKVLRWNLMDFLKGRICSQSHVRSK